MAPEQAAGNVRDVTTAADVYRLGAILYALLAGRPAFRGDTLTETLRQVLGQEPISASKLNRNVDRDLATICSKCLEKSPDRRYSSAAALADDLDRWLAHLPIRARPSNAWQQTWKWAKRRPAVAALVSVSIVATMTVFVGSLWYNQRLQSEIATSQQQRQRAELKSQRAREAVGEMVTIAKSRLADVPEMSPVRQEILDKAWRYYQEVLDDHDDHPAVRAEKAQAFLQMAAIRDREPNARQAIALLEQLAGDFPETPRFRSDLAMAHYRLAMLIAGDPQRRHDARDHCREAIRIQERLASEFPQQAEHRFDLAHSLHKLGYLCWDIGEYPESERAYRRALTVTEPLPGHLADRDDPSLQQAMIHNSLGLLLRTVGRLKEAQQSHEAALALLDCLSPDQQQPKLVENHLSCEPARTHLQLGLVLQQRGQWEKSEIELRRSLTLWEEHAVTHPSAHTTLHEVANAEHSLGGLLQEIGRLEEAEQSLNRAVAVYEKLLNEFPSRNDFRHFLARNLTSLGRLLATTERLSAAKSCFRKALDLENKLITEFPEEKTYAQQLAEIERHLANPSSANDCR